MPLRIFFLLRINLSCLNKESIRCTYGNFLFARARRCSTPNTGCVNSIVVDGVGGGAYSDSPTNHIHFRVVVLIDVEGLSIYATAPAQHVCLPTFLRAKVASCVWMELVKYKQENVKSAKRTYWDTCWDADHCGRKSIFGCCWCQSVDRARAQRTAVMPYFGRNLLP